MKAKKQREAARRVPAGATRPTPQPPHLAAMLGLCILTFLAFSNSFQTGFALDNKALILEDTRVQEASAQNVRLIASHTYWWPHGESGLYRPVTTLSYLLNYAILGNRDHAAGYHWMNWLLHAGNVLLVYALGWKLIGKFWPAASVAAVWSVHPVLTESVTNIVGRADLLAGMAVLAGFLMYLKSTETGHRNLWLVGLGLVTLVGVFSKESAVTIAGVIALYELAWWRERKAGRALVYGLIAIFPAVEALIYARSFVLAGAPAADFPFTDNPIIGAGFWTAELTAMKVLARYMGLVLWPVKLSCDYSFAQIPLGGDWTVAIVLAAAVGVVLLYRWNRTAFFLACFAFVTIAPTANLFLPIGTIMAERFLYLPSIGLLACLVMAVYAASPRAAPAVLCTMVALLAMRTWMRNLDWKSDLTLGASAVEVSPRSYKTHQMLAAALFDAGETDAALAEARRSVAILDPLPDARSTPVPYRLAGDLYLRKGDAQAAVPVLQRGASILQAIQAADHGQRRGPNPNDDVYRLLSMAYERVGQGDRALEAAVEARNRDPLNPDIYRRLSGTLLASGHQEDAAVALLQGMLVTSDIGLRKELVELYKKIDPRGCAVAAGPYGEAINPKCEIVARDLCAVSVESVRISLAAGRRNTATSLKQSFLHDYGCPAEPLNEVVIR